MNERRCETCMWWEERPDKPIIAGKEVRVGKCRVEPPEIQGFPVTREDDWCGKHYPNDVYSDPSCQCGK